MTHLENAPFQLDQRSLVKRMLIGGAIGLSVISFFVLPINNAPLEWGKFWMIRPFIVVTFAGAMGGLCNYFILAFHSRFGVPKILAIIISILVAVVGLWMGIVLGLVGTLWN